MSLTILGIGTALPGTAVSQEEALRVAHGMCRSKERQSWLPGIYRGTGITQRHMVLPQALVRDLADGTNHSASIFVPHGAEYLGPTTGQRMVLYAQEAPALAAEAARRGLAEARVKPGDITHLVTVSCTGFAAPGVDCRLIEDLKLPAQTQRTHLGFMGCHGALNGLRVASAYTGSEPGAVVLLVAVELCSLHYDYAGDAGQLVANAIFADGAAALVGSSRHTPCAVAARGVRNQESGVRNQGLWRLRASGSCLIPDSRDAMTWTIGDHGFVMTLSKQVPAWIARHLRPWLEDWLSARELTLSDIGSWAIHPGGPRILGAAREALGLGPERTAVAEAVFAEHGNMSSPTLLFILERLRRERAPRPCVALGFGPGLTVEAALFE